MTNERKVITVLRLREAGTLDWLADAFGFALSEVTPSGDGGLQHAQLRYGDDWLMASTGGGALSQPAGAANIYLTVGSDEAVDAAWERAVAAGATTVLAPEDQPYGGRNATVTDPEGNHWSIGSYHPGG